METLDWKLRGGAGKKVDFFSDGLVCKSTYMDRRESCRGRREALPCAKCFLTARSCGKILLLNGCVDDGLGLADDVDLDVEGTGKGLDFFGDGFGQLEGLEVVDKVRFDKDL